MREQNRLFPNEKLKCSSFRNGSYIIFFPHQVLTTHFERILKECYKRSKSRSIEKVKFDLAKVIFFDIFELGLTVIWLLELKNKGVKVEVDLPAPENKVYGFLRHYGFKEFLKKNEILYVEQSESEDKLYVDLESGHFTPLMFAFETKFQEFLLRLSTERDSSPLLYPLKEFEVVSAGHFRATVLKEIRDNIQIHAEDRMPYFIMTKFPMRKLDREKQDFLKRIENRARYGVEWERQFFSNLLRLHRDNKIDDLSYFEIVIGDGGPGIHNVLGKIEECKDKKEYEILDYAFEYDTTSRPKERLEAARKLLESKTEEYDKFPPATGLYQVKKAVKDYSGFLTVRSGKTILCYDFLSDPTDGKPRQELITNWTWQFNDKEMKYLRALSSFRGTHYKIFFPVRPVPYLDRRKYFEIPSYEPYSRPIFKYAIIRLNNRFLVSQDPDTQFRLLQENFEEITKNINILKKEIALQNRGILLIDFADITPGILLHKVLHYLVLEMMRRQNTQLAIVAVNVDEKTLSEMEDVCSMVQNNKSGKEKSLVVLDENLEIKFLGETEESQKILKSLLTQPISIEGIPEDQRRVIDQNHHIIDTTEENYYLCFPYKEVVNRLRQNLRDDIKNVILYVPNKIFHSDVRVNIPNRYHVEGFFEIWKLVESRQWKDKLQKWVEYALKLLKPAVVITIGKPCQKLMESLNLQTIKWISIINPWKRLHIAELITLDKKDKIIILTDVIGTGKSLDKVLDFIYECEICKILAIVDARRKRTEEQSVIKEDEYKYEGRSYTLESIVKEELKFNIEQKPGDWSYETIKLVEPSTNALIAEPIRPPEQPLWLKIDPEEYLIGDDRVQDFSNPFIEDVTLCSDGVAIGHFTTKSKKHITYFFLIPCIAECYAPQIAKVIEEDIKGLEKKSEKKKITHIFYPEYNPGVGKIVNKISSLVSGNPQPVSNDEIFNISTQRTWDFGEVETAVIFDNSFSSGFTLERLIDIAYKANAKFIFAYTLMNRSDSFTTRFLSNLPYYGRLPNQIELQIKHLVDARIPVADVSVCPICRYIEKLESIKQEVESDYCKTFLTKEINKWKSTSIESLQEEHALNDYLAIPKEQRVEKCSLRWKLEIAKEELGARNQLKRIVVDYEKNPQQVLNFLCVLYQEILYFFEIQKERYNEVFYFKDKMQEALKFLAKDVRILSENLGPIILVWYFTDSEGLSDCLEEILYSLKEDAQLFFEAIGYVLIGESLTADTHSVKLINILSSFGMKLEKLGDPEPHWQLGKVIQYLESKVEKLIPSSLYRNYELAIGGWYYFAKKYIEINENLRIGEKKKAIDLFEEAINESNQKLRGIETILESNLLTSREIQDLKENYDELKQIAERFNRLLMAESIEKEELIPMVEKFRRTVDIIHNILSIFKCDLREAVDSILKKEKVIKLFKKYNIEIEIEDDGKKRFAFIKEVHMGRILEELFDNFSHAFFKKIEKSSGNKVKIVLRTLPPSEDFLCLEILDNGAPPSSKRYGQGHSLIRDFTEKYGGKFQSFEEIQPYGQSWKEGYTKKSILYLGNMPPPQESIK